MNGLILILKRFSLSSLIGVLAVFHIGSASAADASECTISDASKNVVIIVCPPGLEEKDFKTAGEKACFLDEGICNAWIWDDAKKAPTTAPRQDIDLSKKQIRDAVAIWASNEQNLVVLRKVKQ
jgi:hypothetical protein